MSVIFCAELLFDHLFDIKWNDNTLDLYFCKVVLIFSASLVLSVDKSLKQNCSDTMFCCNDGTCVDTILKSDGAVDCHDTSDKAFVSCSTLKCKKNELQCVNGACVRGNATCDGVQDCAALSDDYLSNTNSPISPQPLQLALQYSKKKYTCKNGQTVWWIQKCNGKVDCDDGSDEILETCASHSCENFARNMAFRCNYGACIHQFYKCNGVHDCADGSDEHEEMCQSNKEFCTLPTFPKHGYYTTAGNWNSYPGQALKAVHLNYNCHSGFKLVGSPLQYCINGWWSDSNVPKCLSQCLLNKHPSVEYLCLVKDSNSSVTVEECDELLDDGATVIPRCRTPNYYYSGILVSMHCADGEWDHVVVCSRMCGLVTAEGDPLVLGGRRAKNGELPWHAGIYIKTFRPFKQICGGSLISNTVVISAAHCFWSEVNKQLPNYNFAVAVGKLYRSWNNPQDKHVQQSDVRQINIPARYQGSAANYQEDIAVVVVATPFQFSTHVRPVCIDFDYNFEKRQLHVGAIGKVAGWGLTAVDGVESRILRVVDMPFVDIESCIAASPINFLEYVTSDKICAGCKNGTAHTVCKGDSGGGLVFLERGRGSARYYLRGVASTAPTNNHLCNENDYTTFTQLTKHENFIKEHLFSVKERS